MEVTALLYAFHWFLIQIHNILQSTVGSKVHYRKKDNWKPLIIVLYDAQSRHIKRLMVLLFPEAPCFKELLRVARRLPISVYNEILINQGLLKKQVTMPNKRLLIGNYVVSNLTLQRHYRRGGYLEFARYHIRS